MAGIAIGTAQWLAGKLLEHTRGRRAEIERKRNNVADYFDGIANTLLEMLSSFRKNEIPRIAGTRLNTILLDFDRVIRTVYDPKADGDREIVAGELSELQFLADEAIYHDKFNIAMYFDSGDGRSLQSFLMEMERAIGKYQAVAMCLRAIAIE